MISLLLLLLLLAAADDPVVLAAWWCVEEQPLQTWKPSDEGPLVLPKGKEEAYARTERRDEVLGSAGLLLRRRGKAEEPGAYTSGRCSMAVETLLHTWYGSCTSRNLASHEHTCPCWRSGHHPEPA
uniref:Secreted protein n=1 Tax=Laticauda laticaudata TaxID=8630 RepID=A0A8C5STL3_LATLA